MELSKRLKVLSWVLQVVVACVLLQTLFFKFTGAPESVYIFSKLVAEPWRRIASRVIELVAAALLLIPREVVVGGVMSLVVMSGAIFSHLAKLGVALTEVGDGGELFAVRLVVFAG